MTIVALAALGLTATAPAAPAAAAVPVVATVANSPSSGATPPPLVVVLDTSGSMADSVDGVVKLNAAKQALEPTIRSQSDPNNIGLWTYPSDTGCGAGKFAVDVGSNLGVEGILKTVDALQANGSTPTSDALTKVVENLKSRGINAANLVLVSDGEANCGGDPCPVARSLAGSGFDLTVQTVGFNISSGGRSELECIAKATGGHYFDVQNGKQLDGVLTKLSSSTLKIAVNYNPQPLAGTATQITATVTNSAASTAPNVRINLAFEDQGPNTVFPAVVPPTYLVGNIPAGKSVTRSWTVTAGTRGKASTARFAVTTWAEGAPVAQVAHLFSTRITKYTADDLGAVFAQLTVKGRSLVIMGDSYSSGEGSGDYVAGSASAVKGCHRSDNTYLVSQLAASGIHTDNLACSGAVMPNLFFPTYGNLLAPLRAEAQSTQLQNLSSVPGAIVMTIGGNDIGFASIIQKCLDPRAVSCAIDAQWVKQQYAGIAGLATPLGNTYKQAWLDLNTSTMVTKRHGAFAPVFVLGYPQILHDTQYGRCGLLFNSQETAFANTLEDLLDKEIADSVARVRAAGYEVYYVSSTKRAFQPDNSYCARAGQSYVNGVTVGDDDTPLTDQQSFHPNSLGYEATSNAITDWSRSAKPVPPTEAAKRRALLNDAGSLGATIAASTSRPQGVVTVSIDSATTASAALGQTVTLTSSSFGPNEPVLVQIASTPETVGALVANAKGKVSGSVVIPTDLRPGTHHLIVSGENASGKFVQKTIILHVVPPTPIWIWLILAGSVLALLGAIAIYLFVVRRWRRAASAP